MIVRKLILDPAALKELSPERRSALLMMGHILNEVNWLRKLLTQSVDGLDTTLEGQAHLGLVILLVTTLGAKVYEGWMRQEDKDHGYILKDPNLPQGLRDVRRRLGKRIKKGLLQKIRDKFTFHYPQSLDFQKIPAYEKGETTIFYVPSGYNSDVFSNVSALAALDQITSHHTSDDWGVALRSIWEELVSVSGDYSVYKAELMTHCISIWMPDVVKIEDVDMGDVPTLDQINLRFFVTKPAYL